MYVYYREFQGLTNQQGPSSKNPANPRNNWKGNKEVLGYMLMSNISKKSYLVEDNFKIKEVEDEE